MKFTKLNRKIIISQKEIS